MGTLTFLAAQFAFIFGEGRELWGGVYLKLWIPYANKEEGYVVCHECIMSMNCRIYCLIHISDRRKGYGFGNLVCSKVFAFKYFIWQPS